MEPPALTSLLDQPNFKTYSDYHTYVIDWQAGYIRWYVDGVLINERLGADQKLPTKPQFMHFSIWTKTQMTPTNDVWGGVFDPKHKDPFVTWWVGN
jgi:beta-glucanase (GH16 family)